MVNPSNTWGQIDMKFHLDACRTWLWWSKSQELQLWTEVKLKTTLYGSLQSFRNVLTTDWTWTGFDPRIRFHWIALVCQVQVKTHLPTMWSIYDSKPYSHIRLHTCLKLTTSIIYLTEDAVEIYLRVLPYAHCVFNSLILICKRIRNYCIIRVSCTLKGKF